MGIRNYRVILGYLKKAAGPEQLELDLGIEINRGMSYEQLKELSSILKTDPYNVSAFFKTHNIDVNKGQVQREFIDEIMSANVPSAAIRAFIAVGIVDKEMLMQPKRITYAVGWRWLDPRDRDVKKALLLAVEKGFILIDDVLSRGWLAVEDLREILVQELVHRPVVHLKYIQEKHWLSPEEDDVKKALCEAMALQPIWVSTFLRTYAEHLKLKDPNVAKVLLRIVQSRPHLVFDYLMSGRVDVSAKGIKPVLLEALSREPEWAKTCKEKGWLTQDEIDKIQPRIVLGYLTRSSARKPRFTPEQESEIVEKYLVSKWSIGELGTFFNSQPPSIKNILLKHGVKIRTKQEAAYLRGGKESPNEQDIVARYTDEENPESIKSLAKAYGIDHKAIKKILLKHNVKLRNVSEAVRLHHGIEVDNDEIRALDAKGISPNEIARELNVSMVVVNRVLGIIGNTRVPVPTIHEMITDYENNMHAHEVARKYNYSAATVFKVLDLYDVPIRSPHEAQVVTHNLSHLEENADAIIKEYKAGALIEPLAKKYDCGAGAIVGLLVRKNVPLRTESEAWELARVHDYEQWVKDAQTMTVPAIARKHGVHRELIYRFFKKNGIPYIKVHGKS